MQSALKALLLGTVGLVALSVTPASAQWTGCGVGVGGSMVNGNLYSGPISPIGISVQGQKAEGTVFCDYKTGTFVVGVGGTYGFIYGDAKDVGFNHDMSAYGRVGVLTDKAETNLFYGHFGWTRVDATGGNADGYKLGIGDEFKLAGSPFTLDLKGSYVQYDAADFGLAGTGLKTNAYEIGLALKWKFEVPVAAARHTPTK